MFLNKNVEYMKKTDKRKFNKANHLKKPPELKKHPITIYETAADIEALGSLEPVRNLMRTCFELIIEAKKAGKDFVDIKLFI